jgi:hypothetical protein
LEPVVTDLPDVDLDNVIRVEEEDHDLLTYNESSARLADEIKAVKTSLENAAGDQRAALELRLRQLVEAAGRNTQWSASDKNASSFLAYRGPGTS